MLNAVELHQASNALTNAIRKTGVFLAEVIIPQQTVDGEVRLEVIEGRLAKDGIIIGSGSERVKGSIISNTLENALQPGSVITADKIERAILLTNDLPGIKGSEEVLIPGENVGEGKLEVFPHDDKLITGTAYYDNFGGSFTGRNRVGGTVDLNSPTGHSEKVTVSAYVTDKKTAFASLETNVRLGSSGLRGGVVLDYLDYKTDEADDLHGSAMDASVYLRHPIIRSRQTNLNGEVRYSYSNLEDENNSGNVTDRVLNIGSVGLNADMLDNALGGGKTVISATASLGHANLNGNQANKSEDASTANTQGQFIKGNFGISRLQHLSGGFQTLVAFEGQLANERLDASQSMTFGGPFEFPAYLSGDVFGDEGGMFHVDLRYNFLSPVIGGRAQVSAFYEHGWIKTHAINVVGGVPTPGVDQNTYTVRNVGVGVRQQWDQFAITGVAGVQIDNEIPDNLRDDDQEYQAWINLTYSF